MNNRIVSVFLLVSCLLIGLSCAEKLPDGVPPLFPCSVKVIQENAPLAEAEVQLIAKDPAIARWAVSGRTDANGYADIYTMGKYKGAPLGEYTVLLIKNEVVYDHPPKEVNGELVYGNSTAFALIPMEQGTPEQSPHKMTVEKKNATVEFDCGKKVRIQRPKEAM